MRVNFFVAHYNRKSYHYNVCPGSFHGRIKPWLQKDVTNCLPALEMSICPLLTRGYLQFTLAQCRSRKPLSCERIAYSVVITYRQYMLSEKRRNAT